MVHKHGGDIYAHKGAEDFSANINYRGMPKSVRAAAEAAVAQSVHYPDPECRALRKELSERENLMAGLAYTVTPEQILCGNGAAELMFALAAAYRPGRALLAVPSFFEYEQALTAFGCPVDRFRLKEEENFTVGAEFAEEAALFVRGESGRNRRMIILGNPNNPTGRLLDAEILKQLIRLCRENRAILVLDESFFDFLSPEDQKRTFSGVCCIPDNPYLIMIRSFTKIYAMPGLRFGYCLCCDKSLLARMRELIQPWNVSVVAQAAAQAATREFEFVRKTAEELAKYRMQLAAQIRDCGCRVYPSAANFLLLKGPGSLQQSCLRRGILIRSCDNFPGLERTGDGSAYFRVCVRSPQENARLLQAIQASVREA